MSTANRKYKDSVFVDLFSEDEKAKENSENFIYIDIYFFSGNCGIFSKQNMDRNCKR